jgi:murein DD-endopeptidase
VRPRLGVAVACGLAACGAVRPAPGLELEVPVAPAPVAIGGARQLVYELHVTNREREAVELARVQILDDAGAAIADLRGAELEARVDPRRIAPGGSAVVYLEPELGARATRAVAHRIEIRRAGGATAALDGGRVAVSAVAPPVLGAPVRGGPWAAVHHPAWPRGHRRVVYRVGGRGRIPGRYAIDWIKLDADGRKWRGDRDDLASWYGYGEDVLAVADGVVATARDGVAEAATLAAHVQPPPEAAAGNYVAIAIEGGRYAFYEHLKPGSVRVRAGDRVRRGDVIAALGFTGQSTGPHLHFHVAEADSTLGAEGLPFVLAEFEVLGAYDAIEALGTAPWTPLPEPAGARRRAERPPPNSVVRF